MSVSIIYNLKYKTSKKYINSIVSFIEGAEVKVFTREEVEITMREPVKNLTNLEKGLKEALSTLGYEAFDFEFSLQI